MSSFRLALVLVLLLPFFVFAVESKDVGRAETEITAQWHIQGDVPGKKVLKTFSYPNTTFQTTSLQANLSYTMQKDSFGNELLVFEWAEDGPVTIELRVNAKVDYDTHWADASQSDAEKYSQQTRLVLLDDSIATQSGLLSQNAFSDFEKLVRFTEWTHNSITYDDAFWLRQPNTRDIFVQRKGVCNQYSHLDMALLRAQGIPSRFVAGWVYSGKEWGPHAWVETLINGKWVPADPTYNEVDVLDGSHVVFAYGFDQADIKEELTRGLQMSKTQEVQFVSFEKPRPFFKMSLIAPERVGSLASETIKVRIENGDAKPHAIPLSLSVPSEPPELAVSIVGDDSKLVFLPASSAVETEWNLLFPKLEDDFIYNFTIQVSSFGVKEKKHIEGQPAVSSTQQGRILLTTLESIQATSEIAIIASLSNAGNAEARASVSVVLGNQTQTQSILLGQGQTQQVRFNFAKPVSESKGLLTITTPSSSSTVPFEIVQSQGELGVAQGGFDQQLVYFATAAVAVLAAAAWFLSRRRA